MATFDNCGICNLRFISKLSVVWCSDCDEGLCQECREHHSLSKASRNHNVLPIAAYKTLPSFIANINLHCDEHDEKFVLFCKEHNECVCRKCVISEKHRECKEISPIEDVVQNTKTSVAFTEIVSYLQELKENIDLILEDRQKNLSSLSAAKKKIESEIFAIRQQTNHHLDKIQDHAIAELNKAVGKSTQQIQSFIASLTKDKIEIDECIKETKTIHKHASELQTFLSIKQLETKLNKTENDLQSWIDGNSLAHVVASYQVNNCLQNIKNEIDTFGKPVIDVQPCKLSIKRSKMGQAQLMKENVEPKRSLGRITLKLKTKINTTASNVSGCCILPCGKLVVSNYEPSYLILMSPEGKIEKEIINIMPKIIDVAYVDNYIVAVTSRSDNYIKLVSLETGKPIRSIRTTSACFGVTCTEGSLIISLENGQLQEVRLQDNKINEIQSTVVTSYVTALSNTLYSKEKKTNTIVCHQKNGDLLWKFKDETVLLEPAGITVDEHAHVFIAGVKSNNIVAIDSDGTNHKILLSEKDLCGSPWAIDYNSELKYLLVAHDKGGKAFLYSVNYM